MTGYRDNLSASDVIRNVVHRQDCFKVSIDLWNFLKGCGVDAYIAWVDGFFNGDGTVGEYGHVWVVAKVLVVMIPLETQLFGIPSPFFDYSHPDVMTNDYDTIMSEYETNSSPSAQLQAHNPPTRSV